ncbi:MAG: TauD/TfdA family dioxygenase [Rhodospirillales bacterium]
MPVESLDLSSAKRPAPNAPFTRRALSPLMAAEIVGLDLSRPVGENLRDAILETFNRDHVLVFRDQHLSKAEQIAFTETFGELEPHVNADFRGHEFPHLHVVNNLGPDGKPARALTNKGNYAWHTDKSYMAVPSLATLLFAVEVPPEGGDTEFADMQAAYAALSDDMKARIGTLRMVHSWERSREKSGSKPATEQEKRDAPPVVHPLVRTHPATGAKSLYIGTHASHVEGWPRADGERLLKELQDFATQERFIYRHRWRPGDLVMWDNRCLLHRATDTYDMDKHRRILHRTVVRGAVPV